MRMGQSIDKPGISERRMQEHVATQLLTKRMKKNKRREDEEKERWRERDSRRGIEEREKRIIRLTNNNSHRAAFAARRFVSPPADEVSS